MTTFTYFLLGGLSGLVFGTVCSSIDRLGQDDQASSRPVLTIFLSTCLSALLSLVWAHGFLELAELICLLTGCQLALFDCQTKSYPLLIWLVSFLATCLLAWPNWLTLALLFLAVLAQAGLIPMGAGDFLYLASLSLIFSFQQVLWLVQLASLSGILVFVLQKRQSSLPFIPFIYLGFLLVLGIEKLVLF